MNNNFRGWRRIFIFALVVAIAVTLTVGCSKTDTPPVDGPADKGNIEIGYVNWAECVAVSNLWKVILEDEGYTVDLTMLDAAPLFTGLNKGNIDFFMDSWLPITHETYWAEFKDNLDDYGIWYQGPAKIGVVVPKYVTIDSIADMKDNADKFKSQIIGIDPGAGIMKATDRANTSYDLGFEIIQGSEPAMMVALGKAYDKEEWIAITGWSPHWMFASYDLKYLDDPKGDYGEAEEIHTLGNKDFTKNHPEVADMLKKFKMTDAQIGSLEALIIDGMEAPAAAVKWIEDNKETVDGWLKQNNLCK